MAAINYPMPRLLSSLCFAVMLLSATVALNAATEPPARLRVAFVIDDGPTPEHNAEYLALFAREKVRVSFSFVGRNVAAHPELCRATAEAGHEINNHSFTHPHFKSLDEAAVQRELRDTQDAVVKATGRAPKWFWPPFLEKDERIDLLVRAAGLETYPWAKYHFIGSMDWDAATDAAAVRKNCTTNIKDGTVILIHEWPKTTFAEMPAIIAELKRQGAEFVTFSELAEGK